LVWVAFRWENEFKLVTDELAYAAIEAAWNREFVIGNGALV
jgi:hypothetical protein